MKANDVLNEKWVISVKKQTEIWRRIYSNPNTTPVPAKFADLDKKYITSLETLNSAATDIDGAISTWDSTSSPSRLRAANEKIQTSSKIIDDISKVLTTEANKATRLGQPPPSPDFTPAELVYAEVIPRQSAAMIDSVTRMRDLKNWSKKDRGDEWRERIRREAGLWQAAYSEAKTMTVPAIFAKTHAEYVKQIEKLAKAAVNFDMGVDAPDERTMWEWFDKGYSKIAPYEITFSYTSRELYWVHLRAEHHYTESEMKEAEEAYERAIYERLSQAYR